MNQREMTAWRRWVERPQGLWVRKALFQIHLWVGVGIGLYVLVISISGSAIVYRREIARKYSRRAVVIAASGTRMGLHELSRYAEQAYPTYQVDSISEPVRADRPDDIVLERRNTRRNTRIERYFDPYTGADLGDPQPAIYRAVLWLVNLHDNLLSGAIGRQVNGVGSIFVTVLSLTGAVIWWPGKKNWRRSLTISWKARFPRFNWDLHSAIGFWCSLFVLVWGLSGICLCFPGTFDFLADGNFLSWLTRLHFGRFGWFAEGLWTILGLAPAVLFGTGALMWWNRVLRKEFLIWRDSAKRQAATPGLRVRPAKLGLPGRGAPPI